MSIPLDNFYNYVADIAANDTIIYRWLPHGSKKLRDISSIHDVLSCATFHDLSHKIAVICHDQEPLDFDHYDQEYLMEEYRFECGGELNRFTFEQFLYDHHLRLYVNPSGHAPIITHSDVKGQNIAKYRQNGFVPCFVWSNAIIARDWFRYAEHDPLLERTHCEFSKDFLIYNRSWTGTREYRLKFVELLIEHHLLSRCDVKFSPTDNKIFYQDYKFQNPLLCIKRSDLHTLLPTNCSDASSSATFCAGDYNQTLMEVVLETCFDDDRLYLTEKVLRPLACGKPFMVLAASGSLEHLKNYGFLTFSPFVDESYDSMADPLHRLDAVIQEMKRIAELSDLEKKSLYTQTKIVCDHNKRRFFSQKFQDILLTELRLNLHQAIKEAQSQDESKYIDNLAWYHQYTKASFQPMSDFLREWRQKSFGNDGFQESTGG